MGEFLRKRDPNAEFGTSLISNRLYIPTQNLMILTQLHLRLLKQPDPKLMSTMRLRKALPTARIRTSKRFL